MGLSRLDSTAMTTLSTSPVLQREPAIPSGVIAMLLFIATEVMLFMGFISAFFIVKAGALAWPPPDQPRLPVPLTSVNTGILLASGVLLVLSNLAFRRGNFLKSKRLFGFSLICGVIFLSVQGYEWARLLSYGLTLRSSAYGSFFYLLIGAHALHAILALLAMIALWPKFVKGNLKGSTFYTTQTFWYFVVGIWPLLFGVVYF
jgi:cytochrome c oxidase subunit III